MAPTEKEKTTKKRLSLKKKPNPRKPNIIKVKIPNPKAKGNLTKKSPPKCDTPDTSINDCSMKNLNKEHTIHLANAVANAQLCKKKVHLINDAMVAIEDDIAKTKTKKRKKTLSTENSPENVAKRTKAPKKRKLTKISEKIKQESQSDPDPDQIRIPPTTEATEPVEKKKRRQKKKQPVIGKPEAENKLFNSEEFNQLKNISFNSPVICNGTTNTSGMKVDSEDVKSSRCSSGMDDFSWIGNISSSNKSNTTNRNTPNDLVVIDGKVPLLMLVDCRDMIEDEPDFRKVSHKDIDAIEEPKDLCDSMSIKKSLSLSSSSSESVKLPPKLEEDLNRLRSKLNSLDLEFINWLGNDTVTVDLQNVTVKILKQEADCISECQKFNQRRLSNVTSSNDSERKTPDKSSPVREINHDNVDVVNNYETEKVVDDEIVATVVETNKNCMADDALDYNTCFNDDEDAISLFAESLCFSGIESSRLSTVTDLYEPTDLGDRPKFQNFRENLEVETPEVTDIVPKSVCEKQNADSTVNKEEKIIKNQLISEFYSPVNPIHNIIFRGVCFFNMVSTCKKHHCVFPHVEFPLEEITTRLSEVNEVILIREYMLVRNYPQLKEKYMEVFAKELSKRNLTRILVETAIDSNRVSPKIRTKILEIVLENLEQNGLKGCEDLLANKIPNNKKLVCEVLISAIADTQNFGRFKNVFVNLVDLIAKLGKKFNIEEAGKFLVRITIFPFEDNLTKALIHVIKNTDIAIFSNVFIAKFEEMLAGFNKEMHEDYLQYKKSVVAEKVQSHKEGYNVEKKRYTSPDTTHLDRLKIDGPIIKRSFDTSNIARTFVQTTITPNQPTPLFNTNFKHFSPMYQPMRGQMRPMRGQVRFLRPDWGQGFNHRQRRPFRGRGNSNYTRRPRQHFFPQ